MPASKFKTRFILIAGLSLTILLGLASAANAVAPGSFTLAKHCPPGFELSKTNQCLLRNLYQMYDSLQGQGLGGLKTALPAHRDGFTPQQIDLGRLLFFDPLLSADHSLSCASCHKPDQGFSDGKGRSVGIGGQVLRRSSPTLWNSAFLKTFFWDARVKTLEEQATGPLFSPEEMGNTPKQLMASLNAVPMYQTLFQKAFPYTHNIQLESVYTALTAFQTTLISLNSRYDQYAHGYHEALSAQEIEGLNIFRSFVARCSQCHTPPLFTNQEVAVIGSPEPEGMPLDVGAEKTFNSEKLKGAFKVPTLRNIAKTAPYMHSGNFATLREATEFYSEGRGHAVPKGVDMLLHWHIAEPDLSEDEIDRLVDFMHTLSDEKFTPKTPTRIPSGLPINL